MDKSQKKTMRVMIILFLTLILVITMIIAGYGRLNDYYLNENGLIFGLGLARFFDKFSDFTSTS